MDSKKILPRQMVYHLPGQYLFCIEKCNLSVCKRLNHAQPLIRDSFCIPLSRSTISVNILKQFTLFNLYLLSLDEKCIGCGLCIGTCPEISSITDNGVTTAAAQEVDSELESPAGTHS